MQDMRTSGGNNDEVALYGDLNQTPRLPSVVELNTRLQTVVNQRQQLQDQLSDVENKIAAARRFYNNSVQEYNTGREQFPAVLIAGPFGFKEREFFEAPEGRIALQTPPEVNFD